MAAGTVTMIGPYALSDSVNIAADLTSEAGAIVKSIQPFQDIKSGELYFIVCTEA